MYASAYELIEALRKHGIATTFDKMLQKRLELSDSSVILYQHPPFFKW